MDCVIIIESMQRFARLIPLSTVVAFSAPNLIDCEDIYNNLQIYSQSTNSFCGNTLGEV